jgi:DNA-binding ferritin-like protein
MGIFGDWKKEEKSPDLPPDVEDIRKMIENIPSVRMSQVKEQTSEQTSWKEHVEAWNQSPEPDLSIIQKVQNPENENLGEQPAVFAPLFVKIDRYRNIISSVASLRTTAVVVKNTLAVMNELEKTKQQTTTLMKEAIEKLEKRLHSLDAELIRPAGLNTQAPTEVYQEVHGVEATLADLKSQIQQLKNELQQM